MLFDAIKSKLPSQNFMSLTGYEPTPGKIGTSINTHVFSGKAEDFGTWEFLYVSLIGQAGWKSLITTDNATDKAGKLLTPMPISSSKKKTADLDEDEADSKSTSSDKGLTDKALVAAKESAFYYHLVTSLRGDALREARRAPEGEGSTLWFLIQKKYRVINEARKTALFGKFFHYNNRMKNDDKIDEYLARIYDQRLDLEELGVEISDENILNVVKTGVTSDYASVIQYINMQDSLATDKAVQWIRDAGRDLEARRALAGEDDKERGFSATQLFKGKCHKCQRVGHKAHDCRSGGVQPGVKGKSRPKCTYCSKPGHAADKCYKKQREEGEEKANMARTKPEVCFNVSLAPETAAKVTNGGCNGQNSVNDDSYLVDSGCSGHMTNNTKHYVKTEDICKDIVVATGNGVTARQQGVVRMMVGNTMVMLDPVLLVPELNDKLLSVARVTRGGNSVILRGVDLPYGSSHILTKSGEMVPISTESGMYRLTGSSPQDEASPAQVYMDPKEVMIWHKRLMHANIRTAV